MNDAMKAHLAALRAERQHHAEHLDAGTAELAQLLVNPADPYDDFEPVPGQTREWRWFAKMPGGTHWLLIDDLPDHTARLLRARPEIEHLAERPCPMPSSGHWS